VQVRRRGPDDGGGGQGDSGVDPAAVGEAPARENLPALQHTSQNPPVRVKDRAAGVFIGGPQ
jgi:hypothetical protein